MHHYNLHFNFLDNPYPMGLNWIEILIFVVVIAVSVLRVGFCTMLVYLKYRYIGIIRAIMTLSR